MKVEELIKMLRKYPKDTEVMIVDENCEDENQNTYTLLTRNIDLLDAVEAGSNNSCFIVGLTFSNRFYKQFPY